MVQIRVKTTLERFRRFIILNTCRSFIPSGYLRDPSIFPERDAEEGRIYVEAASKLDLGQMRNIRFVKVAEVLGVIYRSKSGNTELIWRQVRGNIGKVSGEASPNSIVNLIEAGVLQKSMVKKMIEDLSSLQRGGEGDENSIS